MKKLGIPIARFFDSGLLKSDAFLFLPRNEKFLRIAWSGEPTDQAQIERLAKSGVKEIFVAWEESLGKDPLTYPLFLETVVANITQVAEGNPPAPSLETPSPELSKVTAPLPEVATTFGPSSDETEENRIKTDKGQKEKENIISGHSESDDQETRLKGGPQESDNSEFLIKGGAPQKPAAVFRVLAGGSGKDSPEPTVFKMERKLEDLKETIIMGGPVKLKDHREDLLKQAEGSIVTAKISERIVAVASDSTTAEEEKMIAMTRLTETLQGAERGNDVDENLKKELGVRKELEAFATILDSAEGDAEKLEKVSERISALSEKREQADAALQEQEIKDLSKSARPIDRTFAVSRLGTFLGASLGYRSTDFLADLAVACVFNLARKEGKTIEPDWMPDLTKRILAADLSTGSGPSNSTFEDAEAVIAAVEAYVSQPNFDIRETEPQRDRWNRTLNLLNQERGPSDYLVPDFNLQKIWTDAIQKPASIDITSLCSRSASRAVQWIKSTPL